MYSNVIGYTNSITYFKKSLILFYLFHFPGSFRELEFQGVEATRTSGLTVITVKLRIKLVARSRKLKNSLTLVRVLKWPHQGGTEKVHKMS